MSSRKRKLDLLPSFDEMYNELESEKLVVKKFMKYHKKIVGLSLDQGGSSLSKVDENDKATWLIATCGFDTVARVIQGIQSLLLESESVSGAKWRRGSWSWGVSGVWTWATPDPG